MNESDDAPLIVVTRRMDDRVRRFVSGEMRGNRGQHCILCGPKGSGKTTIARRLKEHANNRTVYDIFKDGAKLTQTPIELLQQRFPELHECGTLEAMFEVLVKSDKRVLLIIDEIHYIFREKPTATNSTDCC